ncbi:MAG: hypothetical protein AAB340_02400 [Patescibacteria group bacterium]
MVKKQKRAASSDSYVDTRNKEKTAKSKIETPYFKEGIPEVIEPLAEPKEKEKELRVEEIQQLKERVEKTELDDSLKIGAAAEAQSIKALDEEKKIKKLLELTKSKGVIYAVNVAKKMDDPYVLDLLHDILAKEGYYKSFMK